MIRLTMTAVRTRRLVVLLVVLAAGVALLSVCAAGVARAQEPPRRIGPFVVDARGVVPRFPIDPQLALSRGLTLSQLPRLGIGVDVGAHVYLIKWRGLTLGVGGELMTARAHRAFTQVSGQPAVPAPVTERFTSMAPQISFNFGTGDGWSYLSGGIGRSKWGVVPDGQASRLADEDSLKTINYGGGARWFAKKHMAFNVDVRFYAINPGLAELGYPGSPRATLLVMGGGISLK
jgi:hypothetical protein